MQVVRSLIRKWLIKYSEAFAIWLLALRPWNENMSRKVNDYFSAGQTYFNWQPNVSTFNMHLMPCYKVLSIIALLRARGAPKSYIIKVLRIPDFTWSLERVGIAQDKKVQNNFEVVNILRRGLLYYCPVTVLKKCQLRQLPKNYNLQMRNVFKVLPHCRAVIDWPE